MVDDINQGAEDRSAQAAEERKNQVERLAEGEKTASDRLNSYFQSVEGTAPKENPQADAKQPEPTPSSDKATEVPVKPESDVAKPETPQTQPEAENPRTAERIRELLEENKKLKKQFQDATSVFDDFRNLPVQQVQPVLPQTQQTYPQVNTPYLNQNQVQSIQKTFINPDGTVDIDGLNKALADANMASYQSRLDNQQLKSRIERFEENLQAQQAHAVVPEIDPKSEKFDKDLFEAVKDRLLRNMYEGKEKKADPNYLKDVALEVKGLREKIQPSANLDKVREDAVTQYKQSLQKKQNLAPVESGKGEARAEATLESLRDRTRKGDPFALEERLKKAGIIT